jgi:glycosyltransferase involved in cell wall biosynthesis
MKILAISAQYPPYHSGGYGLRVKNIIDGLSARGHAIRVLTNYPERRTSELTSNKKYPVVRRLHNCHRVKFFPKEIMIDLLDTKLLQRQIRQFNPDVIYLGHTYVLSKAILPFLEHQIIPIVYDEGGSGLIEAWTEHGRWFRFTGDYKSRFALLNAMKPLVIKLVCALGRGRIKTQWTWPKNMHIIFNSELNRSNASAKGVPVEGARVIHSGIDTGKFSFKQRTRLSTPLKILVPGRIERRKGQLDAVELLKRLIEDRIDCQIILAGAKQNDVFYSELIAEIKNAGLTENIFMLPMLTQDDLIKHYQEADICFFPSYQKIGYSRTPLEAMACGCIVVSYGNEGSDEIIENGRNGFLVSSGDYQKIINLIKSMISTQVMVENLVRQARYNTEANCSLSTYVEHIEEILISAEKN